MTERIYYDDPYLTDFVARVVERVQWSGQRAVVLDRTAFYPTGGGQPHDLGWLNGVPVVEVVEREADGAVLHVLAHLSEMEGDPLAVEVQIKGQIDWQRRFDLMQQHTGQHVLSAALLENLGASTVGFHLSDEYTTIDLNRAPLSDQELAAAEALANRIVFENRPVAARFVPDDEIPGLALRKPLAHQGPVRVAEIPNFDCSACGGTHVRATGEIGLVKITHSERRGAETRVEFLCGQRALSDYGAKHGMVMQLAQEYTVSHRELADMVHRLDDELKETRRELRRIRDALLDAESSALWHQAQTLQQEDRGPAQSVRVVRGCFAERTPDDLKHLAQRLIAHPRTVALLGAGGNAGDNGYLTFARSDDLDLHMGTLVRQACEVTGGRGGGRPNFAQGGGPQGDQVAQALELAFQTLVDLVQRGEG